MIYSLLGQGLYREGKLAILGGPTGFFSLVWPAIAGLPLSLGDLELGYRILRVVEPLLMSLAAIPAYLWARRSGAARGRSLAAALTLALPALGYSGFVMTEVAYYPLVTLALLAAAADAGAADGAPAAALRRRARARRADAGAGDRAHPGARHGARCSRRCSRASRGALRSCRRARGARAASRSPGSSWKTVAGGSADGRARRLQRDRARLPGRAGAASSSLYHARRRAPARRGRSRPVRSRCSWSARCGGGSRTTPSAPTSRSPCRSSAGSCSRSACSPRSSATGLQERYLIALAPVLFVGLLALARARRAEAALRDGLDLPRRGRARLARPVRPAGDEAGARRLVLARAALGARRAVALLDSRSGSRRSSRSRCSRCCRGARSSSCRRRCSSRSSTPRSPRPGTRSRRRG